MFRAKSLICLGNLKEGRQTSNSDPCLSRDTIPSIALAPLTSTPHCLTMTYSYVHARQSGLCNERGVSRRLAPCLDDTFSDTMTALAPARDGQLGYPPSQNEPPLLSSLRPSLHAFHGRRDDETNSIYHIEADTNLKHEELFASN